MVGENEFRLDPDFNEQSVTFFPSLRTFNSSLRQREREKEREREKGVSEVLI